jgi:hypothetical protein
MCRYAMFPVEGVQFILAERVSLAAPVDASGKGVEVGFFVEVKQSFARTTISHHEDLRELAVLGRVPKVF